MLAFLKLIRINNLLIIAFTQCCIRYFLIKGMIHYMGIGLILQMSNFDFSLLLLSTVMIAAAGYIINDYFDSKIDQFNKPSKVIIGHQISRRQAMTLHLVFNVIAIAIGFHLAIKCQVPKLGFIHLLSAGLLWFYSTDFKKQLVIGNIVVSILTAAVPLLVVLYEMPLLLMKYKTALTFTNSNLNFVMHFVMGYAAFAFITTLIREIIKDIEDYKGDAEFGCNTLPIAYGVRVSKIIIYVLIVVTMALLGYIMAKQFASHDKISFYYFMASFQVMFLLLIVQIYRAKEPQNYHIASRTLKIIMLLGVSYTIVYYYLLMR